MAVGRSATVRHGGLLADETEAMGAGAMPIPRLTVITPVDDTKVRAGT
jgi:hypothetical protein